MQAIDSTLAALADPTRRCLIDLLATGPRRAGELAAAFDVSAPAVSRHLRVLRLHGLIEEQHSTGGDYRVRTYSLRRERFGELRRWLDEVEGFWTGQLAAFRQHVQQTHKRGRK